MNIKHKEIDIIKTNPFENCKLKRKCYADILTNIVTNFSEGFVLAINNQWGTGKTTFVRMWKQHLDNNHFKTLYFNAWENDFEKDVLITLISELQELKTDKTAESFKNLLSKAGPLAKSLALGIIKTQIEKHIGNDFLQEFAEQTSSTIADNLQVKVDSYLNKKNDITEFKKSLQEFVLKTDEEKPVVFIIDELDRCRPSYAVEVLERIKHLFSVTGIVFVLSIDKRQLGNAVRGVYGSDLIDSDEYLRRFIDIEYSIPSADTKLFVSYLYDYYQFENFFESIERQNSRELQSDNFYFVEFASLLFNFEDLPLRIQEKIFAQARIALCSFNTREYVIPSLFILLIFLKLKHAEIYNGIKNESYRAQELIDKIESILPHIDKENERIFVYTLAMLVKSYNNSKDLGNREELFVLKRESDKSETILKINSRIDTSLDNNVLKEFIDTRNSFSNIERQEIKHLINKIELTENIKMN